MEEKIYPASAWRLAMKAQEVILKATADEIKWIQAADILGVSARTIRRKLKLYQEYVIDKCDYSDLNTQLNFGHNPASYWRTSRLHDKGYKALKTTDYKTDSQDMFFNIHTKAQKNCNVVPFPEYFLIQTISLCNAKCLICPYGDMVNKQKQGRMKMDLFRKIIDEASIYQGKVKQIMPYLMNEPLLDKTLIEKIRYIRLKNPNVWIHLVTNGSLLDEERGDQLLRSPINSIKISMLGHRKATYEKVMGLTDYDKILEQIMRFAEKAVRIKGYDSVLISFTNTPGAVLDDEIEEASGFWEARGIKYEIINHPISRADNVKILDAPRHQTISGCNSIWRNEMVHILFNGDVILCCMDWRREVILGNVNNQSIKKIWNNNNYNKIRKIIRGVKRGKPDFICYRCEEAVCEA